MTLRPEYLELTPALAAFQQASLLRDQELVLLLRTQFRRGQWPQMVDLFGDHTMTLREALRALHLRQPTEALPYLVMLLDLVMAEDAELRVSLHDAIGRADGIVYPFALESAPTPEVWKPDEPCPELSGDEEPEFRDAVLRLAAAWARAAAGDASAGPEWLYSPAGREAWARSIVRFVSGADRLPEHYVHDTRTPGELVVGDIPRVCAHAWQASWDLWSLSSPERESARSVLYFGPDGQSVIEFRMGPHLDGAAEVIVTGVGAQQAAHHYQLLAEAGLLITREQALADARPDGNDRVLALHRVGTHGFDRPEDPELEAAAQAALADEQSTIRSTAIEVALYLGYPSLRLTIAHLSERDPSSQVRELARLALRPIDDPSKTCAWTRRLRMTEAAARRTQGGSTADADIRKSSELRRSIRVTKTILLRPTEDRLEVFCSINDACDDINERQDALVFDSGDMVEKETTVYQYWIDVIDDAGWIRWVDDHAIPAQYVDISVPTSQLCEIVSSCLVKHLPTATLEALKQDASDVGDAPEKAGAIARLGIGAQGAFDEDVYDVLQAALKSRSRRIRTAATLAIFLLKWPEFSRVLESSIIAEGDADLSAKMAYALASCVAGKERP